MTNSERRRFIDLLRWLSVLIAVILVLGTALFVVRHHDDPAIASRLLRDGGIFAIVVGAIISFFVGALALRSLSFRIFDEEEPAFNIHNRTIQDFGIYNCLIVGTVGLLVGHYRILGDWALTLNIWCRAHDFPDGVMLGLFALFLPWPIIPLGALARHRYETGNGDRQ